MLVPAAISVPSRGGSPSLRLNQVTKIRPVRDRGEHHRQAGDAELAARRTALRRMPTSTMPARRIGRGGELQAGRRATPAAAACCAAAGRGRWRPARRRRGCCRSGPARRESRWPIRSASQKPASITTNAASDAGQRGERSTSDQPEAADDERGGGRGVEQAADSGADACGRARADEQRRRPPQTPSCRRWRRRRSRRDTERRRAASEARAPAARRTDASCRRGRAACPSRTTRRRAMACACGIARRPRARQTPQTPTAISATPTMRSL